MLSCFRLFSFASFRFPYSPVQRSDPGVWSEQLSPSGWPAPPQTHSDGARKASQELWPSPTSTLSADTKSTLPPFPNSCLHGLRLARCRLGPVFFQNDTNFKISEANLSSSAMRFNLDLLSRVYITLLQAKEQKFFLWAQRWGYSLLLESPP